MKAVGRRLLVRPNKLHSNTILIPKNAAEAMMANSQIHEGEVLSIGADLIQADQQMAEKAGLPKDWHEISVGDWVRYRFGTTDQIPTGQKDEDGQEGLVHSVEYGWVTAVFDAAEGQARAGRAAGGGPDGLLRPQLVKGTFEE